MGIYEDNLRAFQDKYPYIAEKIKEANLEEIKNRIYVEETEDGTQILEVIHNGRVWSLNSRWDSKAAAKIYAERYVIRPYGIYVVFGMADGEYVRALLKKCDDTNVIIVCEPKIELLAVSSHYFEFRDLINEKNLFFCVLDSEKNAIGMVQQIVDYTRIRLIEYCILPGYDVLFHKSCKMYQDEILEWMQNEFVVKETDMEFSCFSPKYLLFHLRNLLKHKNLGQLKQAIASYNLKEIPAIIVSAGPSLDKNVHILRKAQESAFIIVVDASVRTVIQAGVCPNLICTIDPYSPERFFDGMDLKNVYWVCCQQSRPKIVDTYAGSIFYHGSFGKLWDEVMEKELGYSFPNFSAGGSVSNEAFMLALYLGFRKIVLVGQDLAFTGGTTHASGAQEALGDSEEYMKDRCIVEVEGIDGNMLKTDTQMRMYKNWLEKAIRIYSDSIRVIDATEGGAKIKGTEIRNLDGVIETECKQKVDFYQIEQNIPDMFSEEQQQTLLEQLRNLKKKMKEFKKNIDSTVREQEKDLENIKGTNSEPVDSAEILRKITEQNKKIDEEPILDLVSMYAKKEEYEMGDSIYAEKDLKPAQLIEKSISLLKAYQEGVLNLEKDFDEIIMKDEETVPEYK